MASVDRPVVRRLVALGFVLALGLTTVEHPITGAKTTSGDVAEGPEPVTLDDQFEAVAAQVPAFGGMFLGRNEATLQVYLTDVSPATVEAAGSAIRSVFGDGAVPSGGITVLHGRYSFLQLEEWYDQMLESVLGVPGVVFTDIDESKNRLGINAANSARREILDQLSALGIPLEAVVIRNAEPVRLLAHTLDSSISPRQGGYTVTRLTNNQTGYGFSYGTLGFNAFRAGVPGFVITSHQTQVLWGRDDQNGFPPADFYQAFGFSPNQWIGTEFLDPPPFGGGGTTCPKGFTCRYSDSAFVAYNQNVVQTRGLIARTVARTLWNGLVPCENPPNAQCVRTVSHAFSLHSVGPGMFGITHAPSLPYLHGLGLHKIGRTTGWTSGSIEGTCMDYPLPNSRVLRCQYQVGNQFDADPNNDWNRIFDPGDSGAPVFRITNATRKYVELYGIVWGGNTYSGTFGAKKFVFSPMSGIEAQSDLGTLDYVMDPCQWPFPAC